MDRDKQVNITTSGTDDMVVYASDIIYHDLAQSVNLRGDKNGDSESPRAGGNSSIAHGAVYCARNNTAFKTRDGPNSRTDMRRVSGNSKEETISILTELYPHEHPPESVHTTTMDGVCSEDRLAGYRDYVSQESSAASTPEQISEVESDSPQTSARMVSDMDYSNPVNTSRHSNIMATNNQTIIPSVVPIVDEIQTKLSNERNSRSNETQFQRKQPVSMPKISLRFINPDRQKISATTWQNFSNNVDDRSSYSLPGSPRSQLYSDQLSSSPPGEIPIDEDRIVVPVSAEKLKKFNNTLQAYIEYVHKYSINKPRHSYPTYPMQIQNTTEKKSDCIVSYGIILVYCGGKFTSQNTSIMETNSPVSQAIAAATGATINSATENAIVYNERNNVSRLRIEEKNPQIEYFLCHRRDTIEYANFIRGVYEPQDIYNICSLMSVMERQKITMFPFERLWEDYRPIGQNRYHTKYYHFARHKYELIKPFIHEFFNNTISQIVDTEWMFPRGRKERPTDRDQDTAEREFVEETTIPRSSIIPLPVSPITETYRGSNGTLYQTIYYIYTTPTKIQPAYARTNSIRSETLSNDFTRFQWYDLKQLEKVLNSRRYNMIVSLEDQIKTLIDY